VCHHVAAGAICSPNLRGELSVDPDTWSLITLVAGIATVLGMIIVLKANAFLSLITAAMLVSVMSPGATAEKIKRVADAFGASAAGIGIVIAMAAVIGHCMMASGAADRIVRAFMNALGEKRAPVALLGSGFVLSVPVFFDTVFYLLIPLARSLYQSTRRNFLLYVLAISAGGAITHTLVPPTPGPLIMADQLGIDVGTMILVGGVVAVPAALVGLLLARLMNRHITVNLPPLEAVSDDPASAPQQAELPGLFAALLPVLLPVVLISVNTAARTIADSEHTPRLTATDIADWTGFQQQLAESDAGQYLTQQLQYESAPDLSTAEEQTTFVERLNEAIKTKDLYQPRPFDSVVLPEWQILEALADESTSATEQERLQKLLSFRDLAAGDRARMQTPDLERMHRLLLEATFPEHIGSHNWETTARRVSNFMKLIGDPNLALLLSAAVSLIVLVKTRQPSLSELSNGVEESLMSGGAIILITAAGGAFGKMLQTAGVGNAILGLFSTESGSATLFLFLAAGIAALMKVAQGSSTTAMIVTSGMMASVVAGADLPYNVVYLATAIGGGSLIGSWMNDSGFWIVARMSGLSEAQALKTWTPLLAVMGLVSLLTSLLLTQIMPLGS
jgi:GntP family gluconate:H+ symporter